MQIFYVFQHLNLRNEVCNVLFVVQWDILYGGHLSIADTSFGNQLLIFYWNLPLCSGHLAIADTVLENQSCPQSRGSTVCLYISETRSNLWAWGKAPEILVFVLFVHKFRKRVKSLRKISVSVQLWYVIYYQQALQFPFLSEKGFNLHEIYSKAPSI